MIPKYEGYKAEKMTGSEPLPAGGYVAKIEKAEVAEYSWGTVLVLMIDIAEGEYKDFFRRKYKADTNEDKRWKGTFRLNIPSEKSKYPESDRRIFNNFIYAIEAGNPGYTWDWNEAKLKNLLLGVLYRDREWAMNGRTGWTTECAACTDVESIRAGDYKVPAPKPLKNSSPAAPAVKPGFEAVDTDDDLPF